MKCYNDIWKHLLCTKLWSLPWELAGCLLTGSPSRFREESRAGFPNCLCFTISLVAISASDTVGLVLRFSGTPLSSSHWETPLLSVDLVDVTDPRDRGSSTFLMAKEAPTTLCDMMGTVANGRSLPSTWWPTLLHFDEADATAGGMLMCAIVNWEAEHLIECRWSVVAYWPPDDDDRHVK